jgi:hypothetical protein
MLYITTAIKFTAHKQPCSNIRLVSSYSGVKSLEYDAGSPVKISDIEMKSFLHDTHEVILSCSYNNERRYLGDNDKALEIYQQYLAKWGNIFPIKNNSVKLNDIEFICSNLHNFLEFWPLPESGKKSIESNMNLINSFWESIHTGNILTGNTNDLYLSPSVDLYEDDDGVAYTVLPSREHCSWSHTPIETVLEFEKSSGFPSFGIKTTRKEIINIYDNPSRIAQITWLKQKIMDSLGHFIRNQLPDIEFKIKDGKMIWACAINNRGLYFILNRLKMSTQNTPHLCPCGCGNYVPGSRKYFSRECVDHHKNQNPITVIKAFIRGRKRQNKITDSTKNTLYNLVDKMHKEGRSPKEIREFIDLKIEGGE